MDAAAKVTSKGQVTLPKTVREALGIESGDEVVFIGQQGDTQITAGDVASWEDTIPWEVLCGITKTARVPRVYRGTAAA